MRNLVFALVFFFIGCVLSYKLFARYQTDANRERFGEATKTILAYIENHKKLPAEDDLPVILEQPEDAFGNLYGYLYDAFLAKYGVCSNVHTLIKVQICYDRDCIRTEVFENVAIILASAGPDGLLEEPSGAVTEPLVINLAGWNDDIFQVFNLEQLRTIAGCPPPPRLRLTPFPAAIEDQPYSQQLVTTGGAPPYSYQLELERDIGLRVEPATGRITGIVNMNPEGPSGSLPVCETVINGIVSVTDAYGFTDSQAIAIVVRPSPIRFAIKELPRAIVGEPYMVKLVAEGGDGPKQFELLSGPSWLRIEDGKFLYGIPASSGLETVKISVSDACSSAIQNFSLMIEPSCKAAVIRKSKGKTCKLSLLNYNYGSFLSLKADDRCYDIPPRRRVTVDVPCVRQAKISFGSGCYTPPIKTLIPAFFGDHLTLVCKGKCWLIKKTPPPKDQWSH